MPIMLPECDTSDHRPATSVSASSTAFTEQAVAAGMLITPMELGPSRRMPASQRSRQDAVLQREPVRAGLGEPVRQHTCHRNALCRAVLDRGFDVLVLTRI